MPYNKKHVKREIMNNKKDRFKITKSKDHQINNVDKVEEATTSLVGKIQIYSCLNTLKEMIKINRTHRKRIHPKQSHHRRSSSRCQKDKLIGNPWSNNNHQNRFFVKELIELNSFIYKAKEHKESIWLTSKEKNWSLKTSRN